MSAEESKAVIRRYFEEVWNEGNLAVGDQLVAADFVRRGTVSLERQVRGRDGLKQVVTAYRTTVPDLRIPIEEQSVEGDRVATRWTARDAHRRELTGVAPTGHQVTLTGLLIDRVTEGKIVEEWAGWDTLGVMQQLGAVPALGRSGP